MLDTIQNEIIEMFDHAIQREIISETLHCSFFGLTADGTTDISACEQFSCCLQFVDTDLKAQNVFLGFYSAPDSSAETVFMHQGNFSPFELPPGTPAWVLF